MAHTYILIDGVKQQTAIKDLYSKKEPLQVIPLYINTPYKDNYDLGPILVAALENSNLPNTSKQHWAKSCTLISTNESPTIIANHLKQFIVATTEAGTEPLFRFADPLITWYWLNSYKENALVDIMGPIQQWHVPIPYQDWQEPQKIWQTFTKPQGNAIGLKLNHLAEPQEEALDQVADFQLKNRLYQWLQKENPKCFEQKTPNQMSDWLQDTLTEAKTANLISERSIAMWADLTADYGQDFYQQESGLYRNWLNENSKYKPLPTEVKIQKFYEYINT